MARTRIDGKSERRRRRGEEEERIEEERIEDRGWTSECGRAGQGRGTRVYCVDKGDGCGVAWLASTLG